MSMDRSAADRLKTFVERIERLEEEKKVTSDDIKDVYAEAKANGYDVKALRTVIKLRALTAEERKEQEQILDVYLSALGMLPPDESQRSKLGLDEGEVKVSIRTADGKRTPEVPLSTLKAALDEVQRQPS